MQNTSVSALSSEISSYFPTKPVIRRSFLGGTRKYSNARVGGRVAILSHSSEKRTPDRGLFPTLSVVVMWK